MTAIRKLRMNTFIFLFYLLASFTFAAILVENVRFSQQEGTNLVDIYYDLSDTEGGQEFSVSLSLSDNGGGSYSILPRALSGDYGAKITPGRNKHIVWDAGADFDSLVGNNIVFKVMATATTTTGSPKIQRFVGTISPSDQAANRQMSLARKSFDEGNFEKAAGEFQKVVMNFPTAGIAPDAQLLVAECYVNLNKWDRSADAYGWYLSYFPKHNERPAAYFNLATSYFNLKKYDLALKNFQVVVDSFSTSELAENARLNVVVCRDRLGDETTPTTKSGLTYLSKNSEGYNEYRHEKTGIVLIKIPAGEFWMGSAADEGSDNEHPQHKVYLDEYYIGKYEVTNEQFEQFVRATGYRTDAEKEGKGYTYEDGKLEERAGRNWRYYYSAGREKHPVVLVSWNDAKAFCDWAGLRLPTEAEWEKSARGTDSRTYPWGDSWDASRCASWVTDINLMKSKTGYVDMGSGRSTVPVGSFTTDVSPCGCHDLAGNVWEWCADWYGDGYYSTSPYQNPKGPSIGDYRVLRGGSWDCESLLCRSSFRFGGGPAFRDSDCGFRVAPSP